MREIQLRDAKAKLSAVLDDALDGKPSVITRHGRKEGVVISFKEWERLNKRIPSFGWFLTNAPLEGVELPVRKPGDWRDVDFE
jgi:prevent-host-death family protein